MNITIALILFIAGLIAESYLLKCARERAEHKDAIRARLARYAGRRIQ